MIEEISVGEGHPVLAPMTWSKVPNLSVIAGLNGAGKTILLEEIYGRYRADGRPHRPISQNVEIKTSQDLRARVLYVPISFTPSGIDLPAQNQPHSQIESRNATLLEYIRAGRNLNPQLLQSVIDARNKLMPEKIDQPLDMSVFSRFSDGQIIQALPIHIGGSRQECENNNYITIVFANYLLKLQNYKAERYGTGESLSDREIYEALGMIPPWDMINDIFAKYEFAYRIKAPVPNTKFTPQFVDDRSGAEIPFERLSDGEKIIVSLVLWAANETQGTYNSLFLLDEIDAHLNPSLAKMLMEIISERIVAQYGIQVIMTTHSPSAIAYTPEDNIFWMERGRGIAKGEKAKIIPILSDGIITIQPGTALRLLSKSIEEHGKPILFVEGETDMLILKAAWSALRGNDSCPFEIQDAFDCYMLLNTFRRGEIFNNYARRSFIGLLDFDDAYRRAKSDLPSQRDQSNKLLWKVEHDEQSGAVVFKRNAGRGALTTLTIPEHRKEYAGRKMAYSYLSIELLFRDELIERYCDRLPVVGGSSVLKFRDNKKVEFAKAVSSFAPTDFAPFHALLTKLEELTRLVS